MPSWTTAGSPGWEAEEGACGLAWLLVATGCVDGFEEPAWWIGSNHWKPIVAMAETALEKKGRSQALGVLAAATRPGMHRDYLAEQCRKLTGRTLRHLHAAEPERREE